MIQVITMGGKLSQREEGCYLREDRKGDNPGRKTDCRRRDGVGTHGPGG